MLDGDFPPPQAGWHAPQLHQSIYYSAIPVMTIGCSTIPVMTVGCICPAGANKDCENPICPRKAPK